MRILQKVFFVTFCSCFSFSFAQGDNNANGKLFTELGWTVLLDFCQTPVQRNIYSLQQYYGGPATDTQYIRGQAFSLAAIQFGVRYTLKEFTEESSLSVVGTPCLGFAPYIGDLEGIGMFNLPVFLMYNYGTGATFHNTSVDRNSGVFLGVGGEWNVTPLVFIDGNSFYDGTSVKKSWFLPVATVGYRFWREASMLDRMQTLAFKFGLGPPKTYELNGLRVDSWSWSFRFYYAFSLNY